MPGWLTTFFLTGLMITVSVDDPFLDKKSAVEIFDAFGVSVPENELSAIMHDSLGYPLAISVIARLMSNGRHYDSKLIGETLNELYHYFDEMIFKRFDLPIRRFLLELVPFDTFGTELTKSEQQVLRLLCADKSNSEIGEILGISLATVKSHVSHILQKLGVNRRSEARTVAIKYELL